MKVWRVRHVKMVENEDGMFIERELSTHDVEAATGRSAIRKVHDSGVFPIPNVEFFHARPLKPFEIPNIND